MEGSFIEEFSLDKNRMTIGRRPNNDIHIDNLAVSGEHAVIITIGNDSFLEDIGSTNGTLVNGKAIKKHVLQHNDIVEFGKFQLKYVDAAVTLQGANDSMDDFEKTMIISPTALAEMSASTPITVSPVSVSPTPIPITMPHILPVVQPTVAAPPEIFNQPITIKPTAKPVATPLPVPIPNTTADALPTPVIAATISTAPINNAVSTTGMVGHIQVLSGASSGKELMLNKALTTLGKPGVQIAVITKRPLGYFITHVEGLVHPIVNGKSAGAQAQKLNDNDVIELAGVKMQFYLFEAS